MIDWASLGSRMREAGTLLLGYSDVCALQLALLAQGQTPTARRRTGALTAFFGLAYLLPFDNARKLRLLECLDPRERLARQALEMTTIKEVKELLQQHCCL